VPNKENQPRPLTTADILTIVNALLEACHNHLTAPTAGNYPVNNSEESESQCQTTSEDPPDFGKFVLLMCAVN